MMNIEINLKKENQNRFTVYLNNLLLINMKSKI